MQNPFAGGSPWVNAYLRAQRGTIPQMNNGGPAFTGGGGIAPISPWQGTPSTGTPGLTNLNPPGFTPGMTFGDYINRFRGTPAPYQPTLGAGQLPGGSAPNPGTGMTQGLSRPGMSMGTYGNRNLNPTNLAQLRQQHIARNRIPAARNPVY